MVRRFERTHAASFGFPHPRGDGPPSSGHVIVAFQFSLPRGDGPAALIDDADKREFSPPAWGWSAACGAGLRSGDVFPTRVGMVRSSGPLPYCFIRFPHPRGDGPRLVHLGPRTVMFSPPAWGWSANSDFKGHGMPVFPTRVGMVRVKGAQCSHILCFPHPRGDGPTCSMAALRLASFSPPAGGWSAHCVSRPERGCVFPTRVGMVRRILRRRWNGYRFPHPRGDGPLFRRVALDVSKFSPPARRSSAKARARRMKSA